jgi:hypothetical protein
MNRLPKLLSCILLFTAGVCAQSKQTDREFEGFKGGVKTVLTETADAKMKSGKLIETKRRNHKYMTFRQDDGSCSAYKLFHWETGELFETNTYIQVDGDKASVIKMGTGGIISEAPSGGPIKPSDPRYDYKYKYKYDDRGRITEEAMWHSNGDLWLRYVYQYSNGERRELVYDEKGDLNQKYTYILDGKGNVSEMMAYDTDSDKISGKEKYEYLQFDPQRNWTKRIEYEADNENDKYKIREVKYRTLTYYR